MTSNGASLRSTENLKKGTFPMFLFDLLAQYGCSRWHRRGCGWSTGRPARSTMKRISAKLLRALGID